MDEFPSMKLIFIHNSKICVVLCDVCGGCVEVFLCFILIQFFCFSRLWMCRNFIYSRAKQWNETAIHCNLSNIKIVGSLSCNITLTYYQMIRMHSNTFHNRIFSLQFVWWTLLTNHSKTKVLELNGGTNNQL